MHVYCPSNVFSENRTRIKTFTAKYLKFGGAFFLLVLYYRYNKKSFSILNYSFCVCCARSGQQTPYNRKPVSKRSHPFDDAMIGQRAKSSYVTLPEMKIHHKKIEVPKGVSKSFAALQPAIPSLARIFVGKSVSD